MSFETRKKQALDRVKKPVEDNSVIPLPDDPSKINQPDLVEYGTLFQMKNSLAERWRSIKAAHPDGILETFYEGVLKDIEASNDSFALKHIEEIIADREKEISGTEKGPALEDVSGKEKIGNIEVQLYINDDSTLWYRGADGNIVQLDDAAEAERDRQQQDPDSAPSVGYPKFSVRVRRAEVPSEGSRSPEEDTDEKIENAPGDSQQQQERSDERKNEDKDTPKQNAELSDSEQRKLAREQIERERIDEHNETHLELLDIVNRMHMDHDIPEAQRKFRAELLRSSDADSFREEPDGTYSFNGIKDYRFSKAEVEWVRSGRAGDSPVEAPPAAREPHPRQRTAADIIPDRDSRRPENGDPWNVQIESFRGLRPSSIDQILADKQMNPGFTQLVQSLDTRGIDIIRKTQDGERLTNEEMRFMNFARHEFTRRMLQVDFISKKLTVQDLELAARRDPDFAALVGFRGPERTIEVFKREINAIAMTKKEDMNGFYGLFERLDKLRNGKEYKDYERGIYNLCRDRGVSVDDFERAYKLDTEEDRKATIEAIRSDMRKNMSTLDKVMDSIDPLHSTRRIAKRKVAIAQGYRLARAVEGSQINSVDKHLDALASVLRMTLVDNADVSFAIQQEAVQNRNLSPSQESGPYTYAEANERKQPATAQIERTLSEHERTYRTNHAGRPGDKRSWDYMTPKERRASLSGIEKAHSEQIYKSGSGWFASALSAILQVFFKRKIDALINKPTLT